MPLCGSGRSAVILPAHADAQVAGQHAVAVLLEITNHVGHHDAEVRKFRRSAPQDWCFWDYPMLELADKTMGIVGLGRIATTARAARAFDMHVIVRDRVKNPAVSDFVEYVPLDELYARADVICLHCPLFPETSHMINRDFIAKMKDGVILINNSRGCLVSDADLADDECRWLGLEIER